MIPASPEAPATRTHFGRVVDELQVQVRVVDRRVAAGLVAADVERVRRALRDLQPRLPGGVEGRRRDLRHAAADVLLVLVPDDHRRRPEAALDRSLADPLVERERATGSDQGAVQQRDRELQVRDPVVRAGVQRRVGRRGGARSPSPGRPRSTARAARCGRGGRPSGRWWTSRRRAGPSRLRARRLRVRPSPARSARRRRRARSPRRPAPARRSSGASRTRLPHPARRSRPASRRRPGATGARRSASAAASSASPRTASRTGADRAVRAWRAAGARSAAVTSIGSMRTGSATGCPRSSRASARTTLARCGLLVEPAARLARNDLDLEPAPDELRLDVALVDRLCEAGELEVERGGVGLHRRRDLRAEEAGLEAAEASNGPEALSLAGGRLDRGCPVRLDAERRRLDRVALAAGREDDGHAGDAVEPLLQQPARLLRRQPAHLDARDLDAVGDPRGRSREREADQSDQHGEQRERDQHPAGDQARGALGRRSGANGCRFNAHEVGQCSRRSGAQRCAG